MTDSDATTPMTDPWARALERAGASREDGRVTGFEPRPSGAAAARMTPLMDRAWLTLSGADAVGFLHDQLTAGIRDLDESAMRLAAYCNARGRVLALFRVTREAGDLLVELPAALAESMARRLGMFVLRARVRIEHRTDRTALGVWGREAPGLLEERGFPVPGSVFGHAAAGAVGVTRLPGRDPRFQVAGEAAAVTACWEAWLGRAEAATTDEWMMLDILEGLPDIDSSTSDLFLPQSLGLEAWGALSFSKGCYPGQEVIARLHYRGRLKRHLHAARVDGDPPVAGTEVVDRDGGRAGVIVSAAAEPGGGAKLLAVLRENAATGCRLAIEGQPPLAGVKPANGPSSHS